MYAHTYIRMHACVTVSLQNIWVTSSTYMVPLNSWDNYKQTFHGVQACVRMYAWGGGGGGDKLLLPHRLALKYHEGDRRYVITCIVFVAPQMSGTQHSTSNYPHTCTHEFTHAGTYVTCQNWLCTYMARTHAFRG